MDFNIGNLVSGAVGAVAVAVASVFGGAIGEAVVIGALAVEAMVAVAKINEDGHLSIEEEEELFKEIYKTLVGAFLLQCDSDSSDSDFDEFNIPIQVTDGAAVTYTNPDIDFDDESTESIFDTIKNAGNDFIIGAGYSWDNNMFFGVTTHVAGMNDDNLPDSTSCKAGRIAGDVASIIGSGAEIVVGGGGEIGGIALDATGGGAIVGVPVNVASAALVTDGAVNGYRSANSLANDIMSFMSSKGVDKAELHHIATNKSKKFDFKNHPAFKETGIDVSKDVDNLVELANHRGRHTYKYHQEIQDRLDAVVERYGGTDKLESAVREELNKMKQELLDGKLDPYQK